MGWVGGYYGWRLHNSSLLRIVPWPHTFTHSSRASNSGRVIPANNSHHGCKYSTGVNLTIWSECYCNCQFKEGIHPYSIQVCTILSYYHIRFLKYSFELPTVFWRQGKEISMVVMCSPFTILEGNHVVTNSSRIGIQYRYCHNYISHETQSLGSQMLIHASVILNKLRPLFKCSFTGMEFPPLSRPEMK